MEETSSETDSKDDEDGNGEHKMAEIRHALVN
jgi:hypothetical protein